MWEMWEKITSFILSNLIPASILSTQSFSPLPAPPPLDIEVAPLAVAVEDTLQLPTVHASSALVIETHSNEALFAQNVWDSYPIASLSKLMTALVVIEEANLDEVITVGPIVSTVGGSKMGLRQGETISIHDLLYGLLIPSGNDAAMVLAEAVGGDVQTFVQMMNERSQALGLHSTHFVDPAGLHDGNVSSAFEIAHLAKQVFKDPLLSSIMRSQEVVIASSDELIQHTLKNTNRLLDTDIGTRIIAGKTGTTPKAGQCLVAFINVENSDRTIMSIILNSPDRYREMSAVIASIDATYRWE